MTIIYPDLPLAVYREIAAHLQQVRGVQTTLLPQTSQEFSYQQSQVGGLQLEYQPDTDFHVRQRVDEILGYYADQYGAYQCF